MNPFLSVNKVIRTDLVKADADHLRQQADNHPEASTAVFCHNIVKGSQEHQLLQLILSAAGLETGNCLIVDKALTASVRVRHLQRLFPSMDHILLFHLAPAACGLQVNAPLYQVVSIGRYTVLRSAGPEQLADRKDHKLALWQALKKMYKV